VTKIDGLTKIDGIRLDHYGQVTTVWNGSHVKNSSSL